MATKKLQKKRTTSPARSEENAESHHGRSKSDGVGISEKRRKSLPGRSKSAKRSGKKRALHERSRSEINAMPPLIRIQHDDQKATSQMTTTGRPQGPEPAYATPSEMLPSATYSKSPFPTMSSHVLPSPQSSTFPIPSQYSNAEAGPSNSAYVQRVSDLFPDPPESARTSMSSFHSMDGRQSMDGRPVVTMTPSQQSHDSLPLRSTMSTIRSVEHGSMRSSIRSVDSSDSISNRKRANTASSCSNWTLWPPNANSTRPTSVDTRAASPFGLQGPRSSLFGPRSPNSPRSFGTPGDRPLSTTGNPLQPYLTRPSQSPDPTHSICSYASDDALLPDSQYQTAIQSAAESLSVQYPQVRSVSVESNNSVESEPLPILIPKRNTKPHERPPHQPWSAPLPSISSASEPTSRDLSHSSKSITSRPSAFSLRKMMALPTIPSEGGSPPRRPSVFSHNEESTVSIPTIAIPDSVWERDRQDEQAARRQPPIVIRNPWISTTSLGSSQFVHQDSEFASLASETRPNTANRPSTSDSHNTVINLAKTLPSWARSFYGSGERSIIFPRDDHTDSRTGSVSRPTTTNSAPTQSPASSEFSIQAVHRPRTRPHTLTMSQIPTSDDSYITEIGGPMYVGPNHEPTLDLATPRLPRDKLSSAVIGGLRPSSLTTGAGAQRQMIMFCIGFVMPLSWLVAAFLPIPPRPGFYVPMQDGNSKEMAEGATATGGPHEAVDVEQAITQRLEPLMREYLRARWWRNLNRGMSLVGIIIVAVVVAVAAALG